MYWLETKIEFRC